MNSLYSNYHIPEGSLVLLTMDTGEQLIARYEGSRRARPKLRAKVQGPFTNTHKMVQVDRLRSFRLFTKLQYLWMLLLSVDSLENPNDVLSTWFDNPFNSLWSSMIGPTTLFDAWVLLKADEHTID